MELEKTCLPEPGSKVDGHRPNQRNNTCNTNGENLPKIVVDSDTPLDDDKETVSDPLVTIEDSPALKVPDGGYGWFIVLGSFIAHMIFGSLERGDGVFFLQFRERFGLSAQITAWPGALVSGLRLMMGPVAGAMCNRYSVRTTCLIGSVFLFAGNFLTSFAPNFYFLFFSHFFIQGIGRGLTYAPALIIINMYFDKRRGLATGLGSSGVGVGTFLIVPLIQFLFDTYGFSGAFMNVAAIAFNMAIPAMLFRPLSLHYKFTSGKEEKKVDELTLQETLVLASAAETSDVHSVRSWQAYHSSRQNINVQDEINESQSENKTKSSRTDEGCLKSSLKIFFPLEYNNSQAKKSTKLFNLHLLKNPSFLLYCMSICLFTAAFKSAFTFFPALVKSHGFSDSEAAFVLSVAGIVDTVGRISFGFGFDTKLIRPLRPVFYNVFIFLIAGVSFILPTLTSYTTIILTCCFYGLLTGGYISQKSIINVDILGVENMASSFGLLTFSQGIGVVIGPPLSGALKDVFGDFVWSFYLGGAFMCVAGCLMIVSNVFLRIQRTKERELRRKDVADGNKSSNKYQ